jgi:DNA-binding transcriptional LysR family regulator
MTIVGMVAQVGGVALVPRSLSRARIEGVRFVPFSDAPSVAPAMLAWNSGGSSKVLGRFLECARDLVGVPARPVEGKSPQRASKRRLKR